MITKNSLQTVNSSHRALEQSRWVLSNGTNTQNLETHNPEHQRMLQIAHQGTGHFLSSWENAQLCLPPAVPMDSYWITDSSVNTNVGPWGSLLFTTKTLPSLESVSFPETSFFSFAKHLKAGDTLTWKAERDPENSWQLLGNSCNPCHGASLSQEAGTLWVFTFFYLVFQKL